MGSQRMFTGRQNVEPFTMKISTRPGAIEIFGAGLSIMRHIICCWYSDYW